MSEDKIKELPAAAAARSSRNRQLKREKGLVPLELWVFPDEKEGIKKQYDKSYLIEEKGRPGPIPGKSIIEMVGEILFSFYRPNITNAYKITEPVKIACETFVKSREEGLGNIDALLIAEGQVREFFKEQNKDNILGDKIHDFTEAFYNHIFIDWHNGDYSFLRQNKEKICLAFYGFHGQWIYRNKK